MDRVCIILFFSWCRSGLVRLRGDPHIFLFGSKSQSISPFTCGWKRCLWQGSNCWTQGYGFDVCPEIYSQRWRYVYPYCRPLLCTPIFLVSNISCLFDSGPRRKCPKYNTGKTYVGAFESSVSLQSTIFIPGHRVHVRFFFYERKEKEEKRKYRYGRIRALFLTFLFQIYCRWSDEWRWSTLSHLEKVFHRRCNTVLGCGAGMRFAVYTLSGYHPPWPEAWQCPPWRGRTCPPSGFCRIIFRFPSKSFAQTP